MDATSDADNFIVYPLEIILPEENGPGRAPSGEVTKRDIQQAPSDDDFHASPVDQRR